MKATQRPYIKPRGKPPPKEKLDDVTQEAWERDYIWCDTRRSHARGGERLQW
jgi:hypothetical protein